MKIVTKKQMRLDELIKYIYDNEITDEHYDSVSGVFRLSVNAFSSIYFDDKFNGRKAIHKEELFTVEVEEGLTEDMEFDKLGIVFYDTGFKIIKGRNDCSASINDEKNQFESCKEVILLAIYHRDTLIWTKEHGIPSEGTLEL